MDFRLHRDFESLQPLKGEWNTLLSESITHVPFLRYEYLSTWWSTRGGGEWPNAGLAVVTAHADSRLVGIAPLFFDRDRDGDAALLLLGSIEISDFLDLIVRPGDLQGFLTGLLDFLTKDQTFAWKSIDLQNLLEDSPTLPALEAEAAQRGWKFIRQVTYHSPAIPLKDDFEAYLCCLDKKQRHEIRRKMRRAAESGRGVRWYFVQDRENLEGEIESLMALMKQEPDKAAFLTPSMREQMRLFCRMAFEQGWLQLAFLEADGQKAAAYVNIDYLNRIWVYNSGVDRRFMDLSPGWVLLGYLLEWANENKRSEFDFMRGNEDYKYRFGGVDRLVLRAKVVR
jgi:CelD/BcsL family acetyltransferase involved in cellulose biosynthesis